MELTGKVEIIFKDKKGNTERLSITLDDLIDNTREDLYDMVDRKTPCTSSSCNNESQNFCDCGSIYDDFEIIEILTTTE